MKEDQRKQFAAKLGISEHEISSQPIMDDIPPTNAGFVAALIINIFAVLTFLGTVGFIIFWCVVGKKMAKKGKSSATAPLIQKEGQNQVQKTAM